LGFNTQKVSGIYKSELCSVASFAQFEVHATKEGESIDEYFARTLAIENHMTAHGEIMEQTLVVEKIM